MEETSVKKEETNLDVVLRFLEMTEEGEYTEVKPSEIKYVRINALAQQEYYTCEEFTYGIS